MIFKWFWRSFLGMKQYPPSQEDLIKAFQQWLNAECHANYVIVEQPDQINRSQQDIDYVLEDPARPPMVAVEVSTFWRSEDAGKENAYIVKWFERVRARVKAQVTGTFYVYLPVRVPDGLDPEVFGDDLLKVIQRDAAPLMAAGEKGKYIPFEVHGVSVHLFGAKREGSDIDFARFIPDLSKFPERVKAILDEKARKLKRYKEEGLETWIVVYNTVRSLFSPVDMQRILKASLGTGHAHVDHIGIWAGSAPDDVLVIDVMKAASLRYQS